MSKTFYSEYVSHCIRFYARHDAPTFRSKVDEENWRACDSAFRSFPEKDREMLIGIYRDRNTIPDNVYQAAKITGKDQNMIWKLISDLERKVAKRRGLL